MDLICYILLLIITGNGVLSQSTTLSTVTTAPDLTATTASSGITTQSPSVTDETTLSADSTASTATSDITTQSPVSVTGSTISAVATTASPESTTDNRNLVLSTEAQGIQNDVTTGPFFNQPVYTVPTAAPARAQQPGPIYYTYPYIQPYQQVYQPQPGYNNIPYYYQPAPKPVQYYQPTSFYQQRAYYSQPYDQSNNLFNMFYMMMFDLL